MQDHRKDNLDKLIQSARQHIEDFETYHRTLQDEIANLPEVAGKQMLSRYYDQNDMPAEMPMDGHVEVSADPAGLAAFADLYPPSIGMRPLTKKHLAAALENLGISFGVDWDVLEKLIDKCNQEKVPLTGVVVAKGIAPEPHIPEHIVLEERFLEDPKPRADSESQIDYREVSSFILVKKNQQLARIIPEKPGKPGTDIYGTVLPFAKESRPTLRPGENTEYANDVILAGCDGRLELYPGGFRVNQVLQVKTGVSYKTGNIDFPGDVYITGDVRDNFTVKSQKSVYVQGTLDATLVECAGDLMVNKGIIGRKKGVVKAGGRLVARFIENCYIESAGDMTVSSGILHSSLYCNGRITCMPRGLVIGGTISAQNGITAYQIGSSMAPKTEIYCGIDFMAKNRLQWIKDKSLQLAYTLRKIQEQISRMPDPDTLEQLLATRTKIQQAISTLNDQASSLVVTLDKNDTASVDVYGTVFPGVYIEISHVSYLVNRPMTRTRFALDKSEGRIVPRPLS
ncbi:DUF342 domain-containing protein [Spirochaeta lutea]|uniref:Flagellar Assembly Protein A N-terminal region domain-containing protein n=1 Tax=Spirochaeta lutea TaxID=1480694 RepID=A0A098R0L5_9SPIO|nr:FapA family protein [Spirochaeta lutea]KGE73494.1 hypothetical protein DC28_03360 [Spirochaeta lutea]